MVFAMALAYSYSYSRTIILDEAEKNARNLTLSVARRIEQEFRAVEKLPEHLCAFLEAGPCDKDTMLRLVRRLVEENREVFGSVVAFEPNSFQPGVHWYAPYYFKSKSGITFEQIGSDSYDYFTKDWYHLPKVLKAPVWMDPYFDEGGGGIIMTTYSCPFFERGRDGAPVNARGIVTADVSLEWLSNLVRSIQVGRTGYCFIISNTGTFVTHHNPPLLWDSTCTPSFLGPPGGPLLGIIEDATFKMDRLTFSPGTVLLAYTDGVTEAFDLEGKLFSEERLREVITSVGQKTVKEITEVLLEKIDSFRKGAAQSDDITIMALRFGSLTSNLTSGK